MIRDPSENGADMWVLESSLGGCLWPWGLRPWLLSFPVHQPSTACSCVQILAHQYWTAQFWKVLYFHEPKSKVQTEMAKGILRSPGNTVRPKTLGVAADDTFSLSAGLLAWSYCVCGRLNVTWNTVPWHIQHVILVMKSQAEISTLVFFFHITNCGV